MKTPIHAPPVTKLWPAALGLLLLGSANTQAATDCNAVTEISAIECESLLELYHSTDGPNWWITDGWNLNNKPCTTWYGVTCENNGVTRIDFKYEKYQGNNLNGTLPDFSGLPNLKTLNLSVNQLTGAIPDWGRLPQLLSIDLSRNQLTGTIPDFSNLPKLQSINLSFNKLTGTIPDFSGQPKLQSINFSFNKLTRTIADFSGLPNLQSLDLRRNQLVGTIPDFSGLPNLRILYLSYNNLTGAIPNFSGLPNLQTLSFNANKLTGTIPNFSGLPNLQSIMLAGNGLTGEIPDFSGLPNLKVLSLSFNQLTGVIPNFSGLPNLKTLWLDSNQLTDTLPDFSDLTHLESVDLRNNSLCKEANLNYTWPIKQAKNRDDTTWQEQLATFPNCLSIEPLILSTTLKASQAISVKSRIQGLVKRAWVELKPLNKDFQNIQQLPLSPADNDIWEASWNNAIYNGDYQVTFYAEVSSNGQTVNSNEDLIIRVTDGLEPPQQRLAIIIAGGGNQKENGLWDNTKHISNAIYKMLRSRGFTDDEIYYLTPESNTDYDGDGTEDNIVDTPSPGRPLTGADISEAMQWAKEYGTLGQPLYLFFTGHGSPAQDGRLALSEREYLYTNQFNNLVDEYQQTTSNPVVLFIDACYSGVWVKQLQAPQRAIISSASANELAYFADNNSFNHFLANYLQSGAKLYEAFELARDRQKKMLGSDQHSQNPIFGVNDEDNRWIRDIRIGDRLESAPLIVTVQSTTQATTLPIGESVTLSAWADAESGMAKTVWALIRPPGMNPVIGTHGTPILPFQHIELSHINGQSWTGVWEDAVYNGDYEITFYANDAQGYLASSDTFTITRSGGVEPPAQAQVQIVLEKDQYRLGEPFKVELIEDLGWGYDLYAAVVRPDGNYLALKSLNDLAPPNQPQNWLTSRTPSYPATLFDLTLLEDLLLEDLPTGQYCLYGILSPEREDVFKTLDLGLWVMDVRCFDVLR